MRWGDVIVAQQRGDIDLGLLGRIEYPLDNETARGPRWDCGTHHELVAVGGVPGVRPAEPWWLDFLGRYGQVTLTPAEVEAWKAELADGIRKALPFLPKSAARDIAAPIVDKFASFYLEVEPDGPEAPKAKGWWNTIQPDGPP